MVAALSTPASNDVLIHRLDGDFVWYSGNEVPGLTDIRMLFCIEGSGRVEFIQGGEVIIGPYSCVLFSPEELLKATLEGVKGCIVSSNLMQKFSCLLNRVGELDEYVSGSVISAFMEQKGSMGYRIASLQFVLEHLLMVHEQVHVPGASVEHKETVIEQACAIMKESLGDSITVEDIAKKVGCSRQHLNSLFRKWSSVTPKEYFIQLRMDKAKKILENSSISIGEMAVMLGFSDSASFSHCFRRYNGVSPQMFRKNRDWLL